MDELIQQLQRSNSQLRKISTLNNIDEINDGNKSKVDNSYILLTTPNVDNFTIKLKTLLTSINDTVDKKMVETIEQFNHQFIDILSNYYSKDEFDDAIINNQQSLFNLIRNLETELTTYKSQVNSTYYNKDNIDELLNSLQNSLILYIENNITPNLNQVIENFNNLNSEFQEFKDNILENYCTKSELNLIKNDIFNIKNELTENTTNTFSNSRLDQLEKQIQYIRNNITIDNIEKIVWSGYSIDNGITDYILDINDTKTFNINKGIVIAKYNDESQDTDVTDIAEYKTSTGTISGNTVTLKYNSVSEGNHSITVSYQEHTAVRFDDNPARINFKVTKTKYYYHFWIVDESNINKFNAFSDSNYIYAVNSSLNCPFASGINYNAENLIKEKFYSGNTDISSNALYLILPSEYISIQNSVLYINNKPMKSNIFEINIIGLTRTFNIHEQSNIAGYYKDIEYSVIKISDTINSGINLNI